MNLRQKLNGNPAVALVMVLAVIAAAGWVIFNTVRGRAAYSPTTRAFFSADDGKTWFVDDIQKAPPFKTADGREAVRAVVVICNGDKDPFVAYLFRYTPQAKQKLDRDADDPSAESGKEFKKPGATEWGKHGDYAKAMRITALACPGGQRQLTIVSP